MRRAVIALSLGTVGLLTLPGLAVAETVVQQDASRCEVVQALGGSCGAAQSGFGAVPSGQTMGLIIEPTVEAAAAAPPPPVASAQPVAAPRPAQPEATDNRATAAAFPSIVFPQDSAVLTADARQMLDTIAAALTDSSLAGRRFVVEGHTDATGAAGYNQALSERRAQAVVEYLIGRGAMTELLEWAGRGESLPANAAGPTAAENRRVVLFRTAT